MLNGSYSFWPGSAPCWQPEHKRRVILRFTRVVSGIYATAVVNFGNRCVGPPTFGVSVCPVNGGIVGQHAAPFTVSRTFDTPVNSSGRFLR